MGTESFRAGNLTERGVVADDPDMHDLSTWSLNLGRWNGLRVRLHAFFLLFAVLAIYLSTLSGDDQVIWLGASSIGVLLVSVLLHELGHCLAAVRMGGYADEIVIGPLGGMAQVSVPHEPQRELITALSGPFANLLLALCLAPFIVWYDGSSVVRLLNPLVPPLHVDAVPAYVVVLQLSFWINWLLVLLNLIPAFPFDGGRALRSILWPTIGYRTAVVWVARSAKVTAAGFLILAWVFRDAFSESAMPAAWAPLTLMAIFIYFSANQEVERVQRSRQDDDWTGYDLEDDVPDFQEAPMVLYGEEEEIGLLERWREGRRETRRRMTQEREEADEQRVDEILARVHKSGMDSITVEEQQVLKRVSARYRGREHSE